MRDLAEAALRLAELLAAGALVGAPFTSKRFGAFITGTKTGPRA